MNNERLKKFAIFSDLTDDELNHFGDALKEVQMEKGQQFITEGEEGDCIYLLLEGEVRQVRGRIIELSKEVGVEEVEVVIKGSASC